MKKATKIRLKLIAGLSGVLVLSGAALTSEAALGALMLTTIWTSSAITGFVLYSLLTDS